MSLYFKGAYMGVLGTSAVLSFGHFALNCTRLGGDVPIHFNYYGHPDAFVDKRFFFIYPALVSLLGTVGYAIHERPGMVLSADRSITAVSLGTSTALLACAQVYAARISRGESSKLPTEILLGVFAILGSCGLYSVLNSIFNTPV